MTHVTSEEDADRTTRSAAIDRRTLLALAGGTAAAAVWPRSVAGSATQQEMVVPTVAWELRFFDRREALAVARLSEAIVPRTDTPGAIDAGVPEYLDLSLSVEPEAAGNRFREGLGSLQALCKRRFETSLAEVTEAQLTTLLQSVSDEREDHPEALRDAARFFSDLKARTVFAYYTSLEGRTEELGLPASPQRSRYRGCGHPESSPEAGSHR